MNQSENETICEQLLYDFRGLLTWEWDDWVGTFLANFNTAKGFKMRAILEKHLPMLWDVSNYVVSSPIPLKILSYFKLSLRMADL